MRASGVDGDLSRGNPTERRWFVARSCPRAVKKRGRASLIYARRQREDAPPESQKQRPSRRAIAPRLLSQTAVVCLEGRGLANKRLKGDLARAAWFERCARWEGSMVTQVCIVRRGRGQGRLKLGVSHPI